MTYFTILHWLVTILITIMGSILFALSIIKLRGQAQLVAIIVLLIGFSGLEFIAMISLDKATKKAVIVKLENKRILRTEEIVFTGVVRNVGDFKIGTSTLEIKMVNHGLATGRVSGTEFYKPKGFWEMIFEPSGAEKMKERPSTILHSAVIARDLEPGERQEFRIQLKYPPYFKDTLIREQLINH